MRRQVAILVSVMTIAAALVLNGPATGAPDAPDGGADTAAQYMIIGPKTFADRNAVARTGAAIDYIEHGKIYVSATRTEARAIEKLGFGLELIPPAASTGDVTIQDFPPADSAYHNF